MFASKSHWMHSCLAVVSLSIIAPIIFAQTSNMVLLQSFDKSVAISGELVDASNGQYQLSTVAGVIAIDVNTVRCTGAACPLVIPVFENGAVITLSSNDGAVNITGNITDIVDDHYLVDNAVLGSVRVKTDVVKCIGQGCPTGLRFANESAVITAEVPTKAEAKITSEVPAASEVPAVSDVPAVKVEIDNPPEVPGANEAPAVKVAAETPPQTPDANATAVKVEAQGVTAADTKQGGPENAPISFAGSNTVGHGLLPFLLKDYADSVKATIDTSFMSETETFVRLVGPDETELSSMYIKATGSGDATAALTTKAAVFGMTSRQIKDDEARRLIAAGSSDLRNTDNETVIAVDSLAVVTHPANPVTELSVTELGAIYLGQIDNWSQVGGLDAPITVLSRDDGSSTRSVFEKTVFDGGQPVLADRVTYPGGDNREMAAWVKKDPLAIGYVGFAYSEGLNRLNLTSACGITSTATTFAVKTEEYPLGRRLYLYNRADNTPEEAKRFLRYVLSPDADDAIAQSNFVNFAVERMPLSTSRYDASYEGLNEPSVARLADQLKDDLNLWDRFSTTVRFRSGSFRLDKKELNDINRLVSKLGELPSGIQISAVGFADDVGPFNENLRLSRLRAETVADAIRSIARKNAINVQIDTRAFSELLPSACNTAGIGRAINRRVEVWVRK